VKDEGTVLVVDDYAPARDAIRFALKDQFKCLSTDSARQGLEVLTSNPVDAVILDIRMPEMDGMEALKRIKEMGIKAQVILLTGHASLDTARTAIRHGAFDYLVKPFDTTNLRKVVSEAVRKKRLLEKEGKDNELEKLTRSLTARLAEAGRLARESELSSEALKEMKNPLTAILGYTQMLLKKVRDRRIRLFSKKSLRYLSMIEEEAEKSVEIASRLTALSEETRSLRGAVINDVLFNVAALLRPQCSVNSIDLLVIPSEDKIIVDARADDLHAVLANLVLNSIEAVKGPGEISIKGYRVSEDDPSFEAASESEKAFLEDGRHGSVVAIEVSDTGCGIEAEYLERIFEPFFTIGDERSRAGGGLAFCKEKVEDCGGHIGVAGSGPRGTTMRILLPVSSQV
jgi:signal transduction histidine kinase